MLPCWLAAPLPVNRKRAGSFRLAPVKGTSTRTRERAASESDRTSKSDGREERRAQTARLQPYILRHTALTLLAQAGCDAFTLARIAGHSSITITRRYIHPQADVIERAFALSLVALCRFRKTQPRWTQNWAQRLIL